MTSPDRQADFQQQFFISQSERLSSLLDAVVAEASTATDPEACVDYLQLTEILIDLLERSQLYSVLAPDQIEKRVQEVRSFVEKIQTVQDAVMDWDTRTTVGRKSSARKRARSVDVDLEVETMSALKRIKGSQDEHGLVADAEMNWQPAEEAVRSIEGSPTPWWTAPFCD